MKEHMKELFYREENNELKQFASAYPVQPPTCLCLCAGFTGQDLVGLALRTRPPTTLYTL